MKQTGGFLTPHGFDMPKPKMNNPMCDDLDAARCNRERVQQGYGNRFYNEQAHAVAQWALGEAKPESVILGELPYVGMAHRKKLDREIGLDTS